MSGALRVDQGGQRRVPADADDQRRVVGVDEQQRRVLVGAAGGEHHRLEAGLLGAVQAGRAAVEVGADHHLGAAVEHVLGHPARVTDHDVRAQRRRRAGRRRPRRRRPAPARRSRSQGLRSASSRSAPRADATTTTIRLLQRGARPRARRCRRAAGRARGAGARWWRARRPASCDPSPARAASIAWATESRGEQLAAADDLLAAVEGVAVEADLLAVVEAGHHLGADVVEQRDPGRDEHLRARGWGSAR